MSITVKAYLEEGGQVKEIRRFCLDQGTASNYGGLAEKVLHAFATLQGRTYELYWQDSDGDRITFSSNDELAEALSYREDIFRVHVEVSDCPAPRRSPDGAGLSDSQPLHDGVACGGCGCPIRGLRYTCIVCPDFNLCSSCERAHLHAEHDMLRVTKPRTGERPSYGGPCTGHDVSSAGGCEPGSRMSRCGQSHGPQHFCYAGADASTGAEASTGTEAAPISDPATAQASGASSSAATASGPPSSAATASGTPARAAEFMRRVGERVTALLEPSRADASRMELEESSDAPAGNRMTTSAQAPGVQASSSSPATSGNAEASGPPSTSAVPPPDAHPRRGCWDAPTAGPSTHPLWPTLAPGGSAYSYSYAYPRWPVGWPCAFPSAPAARDDVNAVQLQQQGAVFEASVASAVEAMRAMGFRNDDGWLTAILRSNGCDIPKAIDEVLRSSAGRRRL